MIKLLKVIGFILIILTGAAGGSVAADRLRVKHEYCREINSMLICISSMIRYQRLDVYEIVAVLKKSDLCSRLEFINHLPENYEPDINFHDCWIKAIESDKKIGDDERNLLLSFGSVFGTSDAEGQLMSLDAAIESSKLIEQRRCSEYIQKGRLYRSVGMLFGTMVGIMLI